MTNFFDEANPGDAPEWESHPSKEVLLRSRSYLLFHQQRFDELYELLSGHSFSKEHHPFLQELWNSAHYLEVGGSGLL